jgi:hypothetical protein
MFAIQDVKPDAPLLNLLCVNGTTKLPGTGAHDLLKAYNPDIDYKRLENAQKRAVLRPLVDEVYKFKDWRLEYPLVQFRPQIQRYILSMSTDDSTPSLTKFFASQSPAHFRP